MRLSKEETRQLNSFQTHRSLLRTVEAFASQSGESWLNTSRSQKFNVWYKNLHTYCQLSYVHSDAFILDLLFSNFSLPGPWQDGKAIDYCPRILIYSHLGPCLFPQNGWPGAPLTDLSIEKVLSFYRPSRRLLNVSNAVSIHFYNLFPHTKLIHLKTKLRLFPPSSLDVMGHLHMATVASLRKESSELGDMEVWATCSCPAYSCPLVIFGVYPTWNISILVQATTSNGQTWSLGTFNKTQMIMNTWSSDAMIKCF